MLPGWQQMNSAHFLNELVVTYEQSVFEWTGEHLAGRLVAAIEVDAIADAESVHELRDCFDVGAVKCQVK